MGCTRSTTRDPGRRPRATRHDLARPGLLTRFGAVVLGLLFAVGACAAGTAPSRTAAARTIADPRALDPAPQSRLATLARAVAALDDAERQRFAIIALEETAGAYVDEVQSARPQADARTAANWRAGAYAYARQLEQLAAGIDRGTLIGIYVEPIDAVRVSVDDQQVMLSSPRIMEAEPFEERIVARYCADADCDALAAAPTVVSITGTTRPDPRATWSFSDRGGAVLQTQAGIHFAFKDATELQARKRVCLEFVTELELLARHLHHHRSQGVQVDWPLLRIGADVPSGQQRILLNRYGQSILLPVPTLERARQGLELVKPWLAAQADGRRVQMAPLPAHKMLAGLLTP